jgi:uncharacterized protein (DUF1330 family)
VTDPEQYQTYAGAAPAAFRKYGATILARGGTHAQREGEGRPRNVVIEFPSLQAAIDCYNSPEYQAAKARRQGAGIAEIVDGVVVAKAAWDQLTEDDRKLVGEVISRWHDVYVEKVRAESTDAVKALKGRGLEVIAPDISRLNRYRINSNSEG